MSDVKSGKEIREARELRRWWAKTHQPSDGRSVNWTQEMDKVLCRMFEGGTNFAEIASKIGVDNQTAINRAKRIGYHIRHKRGEE